MAETRLLAPAVRLVDEAGGKAVLVSDPAQLPAVGAGGLYAALVERLGAAELTRNLRQRDPSERRALARMRAGDADEYLGHLARSGRLRVEDPALAKDRLTTDWWQSAEKDLGGTVMLAYRREDVDDLNATARSRMLAAGRLGAEPLVLDGREFRVGDRVICRRNDARIGPLRAFRWVDKPAPARR